MTRLNSSCLIAAALVFCVATNTPAQVSFEEPPIDYLKAPVTDPVARLQKKIDADEIELEYDEKTGYLAAVLEHLNVPASSQALVFSKTSFQLRRISPSTPRAVYFGDDNYVGWVQNGAVVEISSVDPQQGAIFYSLSQEQTDKPKFKRHTHRCLQCHSSTLTRGVPGHLVRSVYPDEDGCPILSAGTFLSDHTSPMEERWGGWYVTGQHGDQRHLGNAIIPDDEDPEDMDMDEGANVTDLKPLVDMTPYLGKHSDLVALMVMEHQSQAHNLITRANFLTRLTLEDARVINEMAERPLDFESESTKRRVRGAGEPLVKYMLFSGEAELTDVVAGTSSFAKEFSARGPHDEKGRSLRQLDLKDRLFRYPCSFLIYTEPFDGLPGAVKEYVYRRLWEVLTGEDESEDFDHLSNADRKAVLEILRATKKGLPKYWTAP